jgi:uncharacterized phage-associated protein
MKYITIYNYVYSIKKERSIFMISPLYAANSMIWRASNQGVSLTNLKLQKLLYIFYAKYLYDAKNPLFPDRFEAWKYGPVLTAVYDIFKKEEANPIVGLRPDANGQMLIISETSRFYPSLNFVWNNYAQKSASYLVGLTHGIYENKDPEYKTAWRRAIGDNECYGAFIKDDDILKDGEMWFGSRNS